MTMVNDVNPDFEALSHHGVRGMKWGVRKRSGSTPSSGDIIRTARKNVHLEKRALSKQRKQVRRTKDPVKKSAEKAKLQAMKTSHLKNPDRATALRMTTGEHFLSAFLQSPTLNSHFLGNFAERKVIERQQRKGAFDKKK